MQRKHLIGVSALAAAALAIASSAYAVPGKNADKTPPAPPAKGQTVTDTQASDNGWTKSDNGNINACFGQARAWWASNLGQDLVPGLEGQSNGDIISQRAQDGTNVSNNVDFVAQYCAALNAPAG